MPPSNENTFNAPTRKLAVAAGGASIITAAALTVALHTLIEPRILRAADAQLDRVVYQHEIRYHSGNEVSRDEFKAVSDRLVRVEDKLDRLLERNK